MIDTAGAAGADAGESRQRVLAALRLSPGETVERAFLFDPLERAGVAFLLALVTKRLADGQLEMVALGGRADLPGEIDFARRARFPDEVLPAILAELIDRCGVEGAAYREIHLGLLPGTPPDEQAAALVACFAPAEGAE